MYITGGDSHVANKTTERKKEVSQSELASSIGIARNTLSQYETGKRQPDYKTLLKFADYFGVSTDYLLGRTDNPKSVVSTQILRITTKDGKELTEEEMQKVIDFAEMVVKARDK